MACGFISELHRHGVRVPDDVSVMGFDDIDIAAHFVPSLSTVRQPRGEIGADAARMMLSLITGEPEETAPRRLPVELVRRESTAPPRAR